VENRVTTGITRRQFGRGALAASTALATAGRTLPAAAAPVKIRVGWVVVPASSAPLVLASPPSTSAWLPKRQSGWGKKSGGRIDHQCTT
jgi:hypothetical protein